MADKRTMREKIMDSGEVMARVGGYMGFSFREIAKEIGIKSASVHYHFPTKADLAIAMMERYTLNFLARLEAELGRDSAKARRAALVKVYQDALMEEGLMCMAGMFSAEMASLPANVTEEVQSFYISVRDWLAAAMPGRDSAANEAKALRMVALLESALMIARTMDDADIFDEIAAGVEKL